MSSNEQNLHICPECCSRFLIYFFSTTVRLLAEDLVQSWGAGHLVLFRLTGLSTVYRLSIALAWCRDLENFDFSRADMFICTKSSFSRSVILKTILLFWLNLYIYMQFVSQFARKCKISQSTGVVTQPWTQSCFMYSVSDRGNVSWRVFFKKKKKKEPSFTLESPAEHSRLVWKHLSETEMFQKRFALEAFFRKCHFQQLKSQKRGLIEHKSTDLTGNLKAIILCYDIPIVTHCWPLL